MTIELFEVALAIAVALVGVALVVTALGLLDRRRSVEPLSVWRARWVVGADASPPIEPNGSRPVATDSALEAEQKPLADLKAKLAAAETRTAERERQISVKLHKLTALERERTEAAGELAKQEATRAQRERNLERSLADAERSAAEATARIEAREAALATQEAELQQQESELADRHRSLAERERELARTRAVPRAPEEGLAAVESDWWEKQLGSPLSAADLKAQAKALGLSASGTKAQLVERIEKAQH
jgi:chromosome segregation ATPase